MCLVPMIMSDLLSDRRAIRAPAGAVPKQQSASCARRDSGPYARRDKGAFNKSRGSSHGDCSETLYPLPSFEMGCVWQNSV